ncbi:MULTISPECIES: TVP38/TMEM64 family protein [unclassified Zunongwangia]|uniref:TVP38/TMEM64 family protein n=1 Tax=unclassified Zunongwangia TaxID=2632541 RepID=UPI0022DD123A|nr:MULTISPECIES: TVP38/TMEM64 family protein [unclassified Zunongwangia]WBL23895.1 TVP38/TMEM64 family protein [Zunongwangia sp. HRR-M8]WBL24102.1 TVP38/TMEM64 family protein [Zunongwangia sp. HGR-M22]
MKDEIKSTSVSKSKTPLYVSLALVAAIVASYFLVPSVQDFMDEAWRVLTSGDEKKISNWVERFGWFGPLMLILAMIVQMFLIVIPSVALMVVSIIAYGPIWGSLIVFVAVFLASSIGYIIGRYFGPVIVEKLIGEKNEQKIADFIDDYGFWAVIVTRLNPFLSNDAISFVGGILKMTYWKFIGATLVGIAPLTIFIAVLGRSTDQLKSGLLWGSLVSLALFGLYVFWDKKKRNKD